MTRPQQYISSLLDRLPSWELGSMENRNSFDRVKERLSTASDFQVELKSIFQVRDFSEVALSLMWIADRVERDPSRIESTVDEETLILGQLKQAFGVSGSIFGTPSEAAVIPEVPQPAAPEPGGFDFGVPPEPSPSSMGVVESADVAEQPPVPSVRPIPEGVSGDIQSFASRLEKFMEAVQSGTDERMPLLQQLQGDSLAVINGEFAEDYKQFCQHLAEFLQYITDNQYLDDVRVMNLVSNIHDAFTQWANADPATRAGLLDGGIEIVRDFRTMFE